MSHTEITIGGIKLKFPARPYPSQMSMMDKIIRGLQRKQNCLLESPTGSGKTLSLLCAAIAWQQNEKQAIRDAMNNYADYANRKILNACYCDCKNKNQDKDGSPAKLKDKKKKITIEYEDPDETIENKSQNESSNLCPCMCHGAYNNQVVENEGCDEVRAPEKTKVPTIFFATRTHKQISNVIKEFRKTPYAQSVRMTILSSRQHTCIHPQISKQPNKDELCKKLNKDKVLGGESVEGEANVKSSNSGGGCIYQMRFKKQPLSYENYGFKEPVWDVEDLISSFKKKRMCPFYAAKELMDVVDIVFCPYNYLIDPRIRSSSMINIKDKIIIIDEAHNLEDSCRESTWFQFTKAQFEVCRSDLHSLVEFYDEGDIRSAATYFAGVVGRMIEWIDRNTIQMTQNGFDGAMSRIWTGLEMVAEFKNQGIGPDNFETYRKHMGKLFSEESEKPITTDMVKIVLDSLCLAIDFLYMMNHEFMDDFRVAIIKSKFEDISPAALEEEAGGPISSQFRPTQSKQWNYTVHFWCLNPAVAFHFFKACHSVILCSGTLSPMDTFQSELGVAFEHTLEANHVISEKQVWVGSIGYGPTDVNLLTTYKTCETLSYQDEIGRLVIDVCKTVPFGVLCFLPSYSLLNKLYNRWNENQMLSKIKTYKQVYSETRVAKGFDQLLKDYYDCIDNSVAENTHNGALMLAVYRGRASEGLDFSDNYARSVIAIGIPYPNLKDVQVDLKRKYNNTLCSKKNLLNGDEWYEIQAYRAVNQALGRCIRHRNDWGAIILVDDRYFRQPQKYIKGLSKWIRQKFHTYRSYRDAFNSLKDFSENMKDFKGVPSTQKSQPDVGNDTISPSLNQNSNQTKIEPEISNEPPKSLFSIFMKPDPLETSSPLTSSKSKKLSNLNDIKSEDLPGNNKQNLTRKNFFESLNDTSNARTSTQMNDSYSSRASNTLENRGSARKKRNRANDSTDVDHKVIDLSKFESNKNSVNKFNAIKSKKSEANWVATNNSIIEIDSDGDIPASGNNTTCDITIDADEEDFEFVKSKHRKFDSNKHVLGNSKIENSIINESLDDLEFLNSPDKSGIRKKHKEIVKDACLDTLINSNEFKCIFCSEELFSDSQLKNELISSKKENNRYLPEELYMELPKGIYKYVKSRKVHILYEDNPDNRQKYDAKVNYQIKKIKFTNLDSSDGSDNECENKSKKLKITQNSFLDENNASCWQYYECKLCKNVIGFILKNTSSISNQTESNEFHKYYKNKILLFSN